jgi:hypothetical protein
MTWFTQDPFSPGKSGMWLYLFRQIRQILSRQEFSLHIPPPSRRGALSDAAINSEKPPLSEEKNGGTCFLSSETEISAPLKEKDYAIITKSTVGVHTETRAWKTPRKNTTSQRKAIVEKLRSKVSQVAAIGTDEDK